MKERIIKGIRILLIISILITTFLIKSTYSRYYEEINTNYDININRWNIKLNNSEIQNTKELTKILQPNFIHNDNIKDNIIVPGREGFFQLEIDYEQVDVPFEISFAVRQNNQIQLPDFEVYKYSFVENNTEKEIFTNKVSIIIDPNEKNLTNSKNKIIKIYFRWNDDINNKMDNLQDTEFKGEINDIKEKNTLLKYTVVVNFQQYIVK